jgi:hypothetical protein
MRSAQTKDLAIALGYLAAIAVFVYGIANPGVGSGSEAAGIAVLVLLAGLNLGAGFALATAWELLLPFAAVLLAVPAGYPNDVGGEPIEIWQALLIFALPAVLLMVIGSAARSVLARLRTRASPRH